MIKVEVSLLLAVILLAAHTHADEPLCFDATKTFGELSFQTVRNNCEKDPEIKGRPVPVMKCIFKTGNVALNKEETKIDYDVLESLAELFSTPMKLDFIKDKLHLCRDSVNSDVTAVEAFFKCCADEVVEKCKDFEGQIRRD